MFTLSFETSNDAFSTNMSKAVAAQLREIAEQIDNGYGGASSPIRDYNGNTIGEWNLNPFTD